MHGSIGTQLGELLAQYEEDLSLGGDSVENIQKVALISEAYRNFAAGEMPGFSDDFHAGYTEMVAFLLRTIPPLTQELCLRQTAQTPTSIEWLRICVPDGTLRKPQLRPWNDAKQRKTVASLSG